MRLTLTLAVILVGWCWHGALAIDVDPSKQTVPKKFYDPGGGKGLNLFAGDPKRVDRANAILRTDFEVSMAFEPEQLFVPASANASLPQIRAGLVVRNISKRPKTLTFSSSQRIDVVARSADGRDLYRWAADKQFLESLGTSIVMPGEKISFLVDIPLSAWSSRPKPGEPVLFSAQLANYPEFVAMTNIAFVEGSGAPAPAIAQTPAPAQPAMPGLPSLGAGVPMAPASPAPGAGGGLSSGLGLAPAGDAMPGFSLGAGVDTEGGTSLAPGQDPLPGR